MRVICIDATNKPDCRPCDLVEGEVYTVIRTVNEVRNLKDVVRSGVFFVLKGKSSHYGYDQIRFLRTSNIDETELVHTKEEAYAR